MKLKSIAAAAGLAVALPSAAHAGVVFADDFQNPLSASNWTTIGHATIVADPFGGGGNALAFSATQAGGDLFSTLFGTGPGKYTISFDYACAGSRTACGGYIGLIPGSTGTNPATPPSGGDAWLATDTPELYGTPYVLNGALGQWNSYSFTFDVTTAGAFGLKLEDFTGNAGDALFRNLTVTAVPEASTWAMMIFGFGLTGFVMRRRRNTRVAFA